MRDLTKEEFVQRLIEAGWPREEAEREYDWNMGNDGDIDGDLAP